MVCFSIGNEIRLPPPFSLMNYFGGKYGTKSPLALSTAAIAVMTAFGLGLAYVSAARANPASDACAALTDTRVALYSKLNATDKATLDALDVRMQAASTELDSVLAGMTGSYAKAAADFRAVWDQFKATRDKEIIPAIYKGKVDDGKKIANGIQLDRLGKMWSIMCN